MAKQIRRRTSSKPPKPVRSIIRSRIAGKGEFHIALIGPDGQVKQSGVHPNLLTNAGLDWLAAYCFRGCYPTDQPDGMCFIAIGTNSTTPSAADTALGTEIARDAFDDTPDLPGGVGVVSMQTTFGAGVGTGAIVEAGLFNDPTAGDMFDRSTFGVYTKGALDTLRIAYVVTFTSIS